MLQLFFETASLKELLSVCPINSILPGNKGSIDQRKDLARFSRLSELATVRIILQNLHLQTSCCNCNHISP